VSYFIGSKSCDLFVCLSTENVSTVQSPRQLQHLFVYEGNNITVPCRASLGGAVRWYYAKSQRTPPNVIFNEDLMYSNYTDMITVHVAQGFRDFNLSLHDVQLSQYGWYICVDDSTLHPFLLDVLG